MRLSLKFSVLAALLASVVAEPIARGNNGHSNVPKGFVTTKGSQFELDGKPFYFVGANSYWLPLLTTQADVESTFKQMRDAGVKVLRTWGHNAITAEELPGALESGLTYYQVWNSSDWTLNDGPQGLERLDKVVETAGKYGIKVILTFTNNWSGYGGAELYITNLVGANQTHDVFYTNPKTIASYRETAIIFLLHYAHTYIAPSERYVKTIVNRYKNSPDIFSWELANEARCLGDLPAGPGCVPGSNTLHTWYKQQSDFVRSLDPHHLITTGGEGHFYWKTEEVASDYNYNGQAGEDFDADLQLDNIDFGTYVNCPVKLTLLHYFDNVLCAAHIPSGLDHPGTGFSIEDWGKLWIEQHAAGTIASIARLTSVSFFSAAKKANKPVILEEFGVTGLSNVVSLTNHDTF
ncbi:hypothetical protein H0H87_003828 [Tephrocybe sp. NHM501043]|nr:hypothetical protein H0H87_003828 [Tephrocybe sp. NHM501043]